MQRRTSVKLDMIENDIIWQSHECFTVLTVAMIRGRHRRRRRLARSPYAWSVPRPLESWFDLHYYDISVPGEFFRQQLRVTRISFNRILNRELELNFPRVSLFMLHWQALTVTAVIPIAWLDFAKICLPHPSTTAYLMFCRFAKFLPKRKTWGRTRQRPAMTDFHRKVTNSGKDLLNS